MGGTCGGCGRTRGGGGKAGEGETGMVGLARATQHSNCQAQLANQPRF